MSEKEPSSTVETETKPKPETEPVKKQSAVTAPIPFWANDPNILFHPAYLLEFFPTEHMSYDQKLNAVTRLVLVLTIICFILSNNVRILLISAITVGMIYILWFYHNKDHEKMKEGFSGPARDYMDTNQIPIPDNVFVAPDSHNPFSNVLMTDYDYNPNKRPAPPAFNANVNADILTQAKQLVVEANPDQPDIADKLFKDMGDQFVFEQSLRQFHSMPNTTIPNDQGAFAEFCYGSMVSCKEGNAFACARNLSRHIE